MRMAVSLCLRRPSPMLILPQNRILNPKLKPTPPSQSVKMSLSGINNNQSQTSDTGSIRVNNNTSTNNDDDNRKRSRLPVLLFDVMDTIVRDPFYEDIPAFFGMSFKKLIECKHPIAWIEFEKGLINEMELARNFFQDGSPVDLEALRPNLYFIRMPSSLNLVTINVLFPNRFPSPLYALQIINSNSYIWGLKDCMRRGYSYIEGIEGLLHALKKNNYEMHAFTNYPIWYEMIENKLKLSTYLSWSFCSCIIGKRKPEHNFYTEVVRSLDVEPGNCIFIDDRLQNVEAAVEAGMVGLHFKAADVLRHDLHLLGVNISEENHIAESSSSVRLQ